MLQSSRIPPELIQAIFAWLDPLKVYQYRRLCRRIWTSLTDRYFATQNLAHSIPHNIKESTVSNKPGKLDLFWLKAPSFFQEAFADAKLRPLTALAGAKQSLSLVDTGLCGPVPVEIGLLVALKSLTLSGIHWKESIPPTLGRLKKLSNLSIHNTSIGGSIPRELGDLRSLQSLNLSKNALTGTIPVDIGQLKELRILKLDCNKLSGPIIKELGLLLNLTQLYLDGNHLDPLIPLELGNLINLESLTIDENSSVSHRTASHNVVPDAVSVSEMERKLWQVLNDVGWEDCIADLGELMSIEMQVVEQYEDVIKEFERNFTEHCSSVNEYGQSSFARMRELENEFHERFSESILFMFERFSKGDLEDIEDELRDILSDKDALVNTVNGSHDFRLAKFDHQEDLLVSGVGQELESMTRKLHDAEVQRDRDRVCEIFTFIDKCNAEIELAEENAY
ncbi:Dynein regulatory complex subunit 3 [Rhizoclosmatium sp. JEL0117]|nr:Dynein regulatory complex subunit 3 [Rhizoclosmatium sp. JEL0117]